MKRPKLRELKEAVKAVLKGPCTISFPHKPHTPLPKFRGRPAPDDKECIACGACAAVCPARAIEVKEDLSVKPPRREINASTQTNVLAAASQRHPAPHQAKRNRPVSEPPRLRHARLNQNGDRPMRNDAIPANPMSNISA